jgi:hypothetical protein
MRTIYSGEASDKLLEKFLIVVAALQTVRTSQHQQTTAMASTKLRLWVHAPQRSRAPRRFLPEFREPMALADAVKIKQWPELQCVC